MDDLVGLASRLHAAVVIVEKAEDFLLARKIVRVNRDLRRGIRLGVAERLQVLFKGRLLAGHHRAQQLRQLLLAFIHPDRTGQRLGVDRKRLLEVFRETAHRLRHRRGDLAFDLPHDLPHRGRDLLFHRLRHRAGVGRHGLLQVALQRIRNLRLQRAGVEKAAHAGGKLLLRLGRLQVIGKGLADFTRVGQMIRGRVFLIARHNSIDERLELLGRDRRAAIYL